LAIDGRQAGPLELLTVSRRWERLLLDTPSLWNQIYIQNGEDEIARISIFLHLSRKCSLHVDILTALLTMDHWQLITENMSRVATISIRPGVSDTITALHMEQWKQAASSTLARLFKGQLPSNINSTSCFGFSLRENGALYYSIISMKFTTANMVASTDKQDRLTAIPLNRMWEEQIARCAFVSRWCIVKLCY
jgi:hypothetical protein